jgi:hypothetical protein
MLVNVFNSQKLDAAACHLQIFGRFLAAVRDDNGINPSLNWKLEKLSGAVAARNTFGAIADEYVANLETRDMVRSDNQQEQLLLVDLCSQLRDGPIAEIRPIEISPRQQSRHYVH